MRKLDRNAMIYKDYTLGEVSKVVTDAYWAKSSVAKYTAEERAETADKILKDMSKDYDNITTRNKMFQIITTTATEIIPNSIGESLDKLVNVHRFKEGDRARVRLKNGKVKAYHVALGGTVQRQRIYNRYVDFYMEAVQTKIYEELPRLKAGLADFSELMNAAIDGINEEIHNMIAQTLVTAIKSVPDSNKGSGDKVDEKEFDKIISKIESYGKPLIIGTRMGLSALPKLDSTNADDDIYNYGYLGKYKGCDVIRLDNPVTDTTNTEFTLPNEFLYVVPEGREKIVQVGFEGDAYIRETQGEDWTQNFEMMIQADAVTLEVHHIGVYENTALK